MNWWDWQQRDGYEYRFLGVERLKTQVRRLATTSGAAGCAPDALPGLSTRPRHALRRAGYGTRADVAALVRGDLGAGYGLLGVRNLGEQGRAEVLAWLRTPEPNAAAALPEWVGEEQAMPRGWPLRLRRCRQPCWHPPRTAAAVAAFVVEMTPWAFLSGLWGPVRPRGGG